MTLPVVLVAAAALVDADGRVLIAQRPEGKSLAGLWEFPGGKVEPGETPEECLIRELREEIGVETKVNLSAVGQNFQDHMLLTVVNTSQYPSLSVSLSQSVF